MSSNLTLNFGLHTWEPEDDFLRTEFNENFEAIDGHMARMAAGVYVGDGAASRDIDLGFHPQAVLMASGGQYLAISGSGSYGGLALRDHPSGGVTVTETGFTVIQRYQGTYCNQEGGSYHFWAFG